MRNASGGSHFLFCVIDLNFQKLYHEFITKLKE